jgi:hypothetical protein
VPSVWDGGNTWNREHVWPKSLGWFDETGAGADIHHIRPTDNNANSSRGNKPYGEVEHSDSNKKTTNISGFGAVHYGYATKDYFEPLDQVKGDIARIIFYLMVRYEEADNYTFSTIAQSKEMLLRWNEQDPVDDFERYRNEQGYLIQGNRNPFIDHPEFIIMIYDKTYNGAGALNDSNPFEEDIDPQEEKERFEELVNSIGTIDENSYEKLEEAKNYYNNMSQDAKDISLKIYDDLLALIEAYEEYMDVYGVEITIDLINAIGEVTLESKNEIEKAEAAYNDLTEEQKSSVTNYQTLLDAREEFDVIYEQWLLEQQEKEFEVSFGSIEGASSSYKSNVTLTSGDKSFVASYCYKQGTEFRLGHNESAKGETNIVTASGTSYSNSTSLKTLFMFKGTKITLTSTGKYGTVNKLYILNSLDGNTWKNIASFDGNFSGSRTYEADITSYESSYYAILIAGSTPRLVLNTLKFS